MSNAPKYRKKAVEYEQLKQFDRAVASYIRAIEENENAGEEVDVALFNKVGDLTLRQGRVTEAVTYYERAVEHYVSNSLFDNAIALCNKILRNAPGRSNVYFTLGRICGRKGLRADATRNFLEYATRMQQQGRVDEGMRALAEVADLMPELTEVGRLVEEHAARAGISLAPRRRPTPASAQPQVANDPARSFGLSKDLVFLQVDYETVRIAREKTPPPQRSIVDESPLAPAAAKSDVSVESVLRQDAAEIAASDKKATARLEDLMIFDPSGEGAGPIPDGEIDTVVDGASIIKPYAELSTPVASLDDLEPTELAEDETRETEPSAAESTSDNAAAASRSGTPVISVRVVTIPNFPAIAEELELVAANGEGQDATTHESGDATAASDFVDFAAVNASANVAAVHESIDSIAAGELLAVSNVDVLATVPAVEPANDALVHELENAAVADELADILAVQELEEIVAIAAREDSAEMFATTDVVIDADLEGTVNHVDVVGVDDAVVFEAVVEADVDALLAQPEVTAHAEFVDIAIPTGNETEFTASPEVLEGFTPADEPPDASSVEVTATDGLVAADIVADALDENFAADLAITVQHDERTFESEGASAIDFDAMLEDEQPEIAQLADLQAEEFEGGNDELVAARFVRSEEDERDQLVDAFESADELPPLIFPMPSDHEAHATAEEQPASEALSEIVFLDIPGVDAFDPTPVELELIEPEAAPIDVSFDLIDDLPSQPTALPLDDGLELIAELVDVPAAAEDDLGDLFGDADVPTAVVAAEATLVASSRCTELRLASEAEPENFVLRRRLAEALFESSNRDDAITELVAALAGAELAGALPEATEIADQLVRVAGDEVTHHQKRLELTIRLGDQMRLRDAYLDLADMLVRRGEDLRAKAVYARVLEIDPWDDRARTALGDAAPPPPPRPPVAGSDDGHVSLADWLRDDDEPASTRLRMREPDISGDEQDDFNSLLKHFKEGVARSLGEDDYESHYDLGIAYKEMGLLDDAISEFQMALRSRSNRLAAYEALGQCFIEQQSYKVAVTVLSRALHEPAIQDEQRVGVLYLLGISCEELQRFDEARGYFQRVYATDIHFRDVGQRLADLERTVR